MYTMDEVTLGLRESSALGRAWAAKIGDHLPYGQLVLLAVATLCDEGRGCSGGRDGLRTELTRMTGLEAWRISEVLRVLERDGHLVEVGGRLSVA